MSTHNYAYQGISHDSILPLQFEQLGHNALERSVSPFRGQFESQSPAETGAQVAFSNTGRNIEIDMDTSGYPTHHQVTLLSQKSTSQDNDDRLADESTEGQKKRNRKAYTKRSKKM